MAKSKVEFIITSEDGKAIQNLNKLMESSRKLGDQLDTAGKKGKTSLDDIGKSALDAAAGVIGIGGPITIVAEAMEVATQKAEGFRREMERIGPVTVTYADSIGKILAGSPGTTLPEAADIDSVLKSIIKGKSLGPGALSKMALSYASLQSIAPNLSSDELARVVNEAAQYQELDPSVDPNTMAEGIGAIVKTGFSANTAQNFIALQKKLGEYKSVNDVAAVQDPLVDAVEAGGLNYTDAAALQTFLTNYNMTGSDASGVVESIVYGSKANAEKIKQLTGVDLKGDPISQFLQTVDLRRSGTISESDFNETMSAFGLRGLTGRKVSQSLIDGSGMSQYESIRDAFIYEGQSSRDIVGDSIDVKRRMDGFLGVDQLKATQSTIEGLRASNPQLSELYFSAERYGEELKARGLSQSQIDTGKKAYMTYGSMGIRGDEYLRSRAERMVDVAGMPFGETYADVQMMISSSSLFSGLQRWVAERKGATLDNDFRVELKEELLKIFREISKDLHRAPSARLAFSGDQ